MNLSPEDALAVLSRPDPDRRRGSARPLSVRDGALLALVAVGLTSREIAVLRASAVAMAEGRVTVTVPRRGGDWSKTLRPHLAKRLLDWLTENRLWAEAGYLFSSQQGPLTHAAIRKALACHLPCNPRRRRATHSTRPAGRGRPQATVNTLELLTLWEGRGGRRPLPLCEAAARLGISPTTARHRLIALRAAGQVDDEARARNLATRGTRRPTGPRPRPITDTALAAAWARKPTITAIARALHVSRTRIRARLQELGLLGEQEKRP